MFGNIFGVVNFPTETTVNVNAYGPYGVTALQIACYEGHEDVVHLLVQAQANVNILVSEHDQNGVTPLHVAVIRVVVCLLLAVSAKQNPVVSMDGYDTGFFLKGSNIMPLHFAVIKYAPKPADKAAAIKLLVSFGADVAARMLLPEGLGDN